MSEHDTQKSEEEAIQQEEKRTFVEDGTAFKGELSSNCHVVVRGKVEGDVIAPKLTVTETGSVIGNAHAERIESEGVLAGTIEAEELLLSGQVQQGTLIRAKRMEVKLSRNDARYEVTFGACTLEVGDDPRAELSAAAAATDGVSKPEAAPAQLAADATASGEKAAAQAKPEEANAKPVEAQSENRNDEGKAGGRKRGKHKREEQNADASAQNSRADAAETSTTPANPSSPPPA